MVCKSFTGVWNYCCKIKILQNQQRPHLSWNWLKKMQKKVLTTIGLCALCTYFSNHNLHFFRLIDMFCPHRRQLINTSKVFGKTAFGRVLKPTIFIQICTLFLSNLGFYSCLFHCISFSLFTIWFLRDSIEIHLSYCKTNASKINTSTVQSLDTFSVNQNLHKPQQFFSVIRVSNTGKCLTPTPWVNVSPTHKPPTMQFYTYISI